MGVLKGQIMADLTKSAYEIVVENEIVVEVDEEKNEETEEGEERAGYKTKSGGSNRSLYQ